MRTGAAIARMASRKLSSRLPGWTPYQVIDVAAKYWWISFAVTQCVFDLRVATAGDAEGGIEMTTNIRLIRKFAYSLALGDRSAALRIVRLISYVLVACYLMSQRNVDEICLSCVLYACCSQFFPDPNEVDLARKAEFAETKFQLDFLSEPSGLEDFGLGGFARKPKSFERVKSGDEMFIVAYPHFNVNGTHYALRSCCLEAVPKHSTFTECGNLHLIRSMPCLSEMLAVEELFRFSAEASGRPIIVFNGELDRIRTGCRYSSPLLLFGVAFSHTFYSWVCPFCPCRLPVVLLPQTCAIGEKFSSEV